jgi:hypothetical protein
VALLRAAAFFIFVAMNPFARIRRKSVPSASANMRQHNDLGGIAQGNGT